MLPGAFIYRAHQRHQSIVSGPLVNKVPQGAHNANKGKSAPLQPGFVLHTITDRSVCRFLGDYTVSALIVVGRFCGAVWAPHPTLPTNRAGGYYPPLRSIGYKNALVGAAICRPPCPLDCFSQICPAPNLEQLVVGSSPIQKTKRTEHIRQYTILVGLQGCATCYETVHWTVSSKFVFAKFGAACRWFESINSERKADTQKRIGFSLAPQVGLEPTTLRLTAACSTN